MIKAVFASGNLKLDDLHFDPPSLYSNRVSIYQENQTHMQQIFSTNKLQKAVRISFLSNC